MKLSYVTKSIAILKDLGRFDGDVVLQPKPGTVEGVDERVMELAGIKILYLPPSEKMEHALDASRKNTWQLQLEWDIEFLQLEIRPFLGWWRDPLQRLVKRRPGWINCLPLAIRTYLEDHPRGEKNHG